MDRRASTVIGVVAAALVLAACTASGGVAPSASPDAGSEAVSPGLTAQFDVELAGDLSDYSRGILEDKKITGDEYEDADSRYIDCVNANFPGRVPPAYGPEPQPDGTIAHGFDGTKEDLAMFDRIEPACLREYLGDGAIESLYWQGIKNPQGLPLEQLIINCLVKKGLVDPDTYGVDQLNADIGVSFNDPSADTSKATGLDFNREDAEHCYTFQN